MFPRPPPPTTQRSGLAYLRVIIVDRRESAPAFISVKALCSYLNQFTNVTTFVIKGVVQIASSRSLHHLHSYNEIVDLRKYSTFHVFCQRLSGSSLYRWWLWFELPVVSV